MQILQETYRPQGDEIERSFLMADKKGVIQFLKEVRAELNKVSWPTKDELFSYTGVVGLAVVIVCLLIWVCDTAFAKLFRLILG